MLRISESSILAVCVIFLWSCQEEPHHSTVSTAHGDGTLWTAASHGDLLQVQRLLGAGAKINAREGGNGKAALHYAAQSKNLQLVRYLIQQGADVNAKAPGNITPLMLSVDKVWGQPDIALELIQAGADVSAADANGDTALLIATAESSYSVMQALLAKGADPNARGLAGRTALHYAAMDGLVEQAKLLLEHGADPTIRDWSGTSAIDEAQTTNPDVKVRKRFEKTKTLLVAASCGRSPVDRTSIGR